MIHHVFSVYDSAAKAYLPPFHLPRDGMAIRAFSDCANSKDHQFSQHPGDYTLFQIGTFDDNLGIYENLKPGPRSLGTALSYIAPKPPSPNQLDLIDNQGMQ